MIIFLNIKTISDLINLGHRTTYIIDSNKFNNFVVFVNYFLFNFMIKINACKIKHQSYKRILFEIVITL
jgi:hypothetical protein